MKDIAEKVMEWDQYPEEAVQLFREVKEKIQENSPWRQEMEHLVRVFMGHPEFPISHVLNRLSRLAAVMGYHPYTLHFVFYQYCMEPLWERYQEAEIPEEIFRDSMRDFKSKLTECIEVYQVPGTSVGHWHKNFFYLDRFALGRLQFECRAFRMEKYEKAGYVVKEGDPVINMHIPSGAPLTQEACLDAYKRAYKMFQSEFGDGPAVFVCDFWLLDPGSDEFLPPCNILKFKHNFEIIDGEVDEEFHDAWRVFGREYRSEVKDLPRRTGLQRAYADHLEKGGKVMTGYGVFFFDGEKIL